MVKYECFRCGYFTIHRNSMRNHLNRKNICNSVDDDVEIEEIKKYYGFENYTESLQITPKSLQITPNTLQITPFRLQTSPSKKLQITPFWPQNHSKITPNHSILKIISRCVNTV